MGPSHTGVVGRVHRGCPCGVPGRRGVGARILAGALVELGAGGGVNRSDAASACRVVWCRQNWVNVA